MGTGKTPDRLVALAQSGPCGLMLTDVDGTVEWVNDTFAAWLGVAPEDVVGKKVQQFMAVGARIFHQTHWQPLLSMQGSISEVLLDFMRSDKTKVPIVLNARLRAENGRSVHEIAAFAAHDRRSYERELVTARERAEELLLRQTRTQVALEATERRLLLALEAAQLHVWEQGADGERTYADSVALLLGKSQPEPVQHSAFSTRATVEHDATVQVGIAPSAADNGLRRSLYRVRGVDGVERMVLETARADIDGGEHVTGVLQDVSDFIRHAQAARVRAEFAEQMVAIASHDLRNPLNAVQLATYMLAQDEEDESRRRMFDAIEASTRRATRMVGDLLDFTSARIGRGLAVELRDVDLHELGERCIAEARLAYAGRRIAYQKVGTPLASGDADRLFQVLSNLLSNAMTYGDVGREVTVSTGVVQGVALMTVHNWGEPIPAGVRASMFEPMFRGTTVASATRSIGLGLFIVREIVRGHRGEVSVASSSDEGTLFQVTFPSQSKAESEFALAAVATNGHLDGAVGKRAAGV